MYFNRLPDADDSHTIVPEWLWLDTVCGENLTWNGYNQVGTSKVLNDYARKLRVLRDEGRQGALPAAVRQANDERTE